MHKIEIHYFPSYQIQQKSAQFIADFLSAKLNMGTVFLLLSGGSAISMYQMMFEKLATKLPDWSGLTVSLFDERFINSDSVDSNGQQIHQSGILALLAQHGASWIPMLATDQTSGEKQAEKINALFADLINSSDFSIALAGTGDDGHTAGLLPTQSDSPNRKKLFETDQLVTYYEVIPTDSDNPFTHRLTSTPALIKNLDQVIVYATGEKKRPALLKLLAGTDSIHQSPSIALRMTDNPCLLLTDVSF